MSVNKKSYLEDIQARFARLMEQFNEIKQADDESLAKRPLPNKWSAIENLEHMNLSHQGYLTNMEKHFATGRQQEWASYSHGFLGKKFIHSMAPQNGEIKNKMKTFKKVEPKLTQKSNSQVIADLTSQMERLGRLIEQAGDFPIGKMKVNSLLGPVIRFKVGDALLIVLVHSERHLLAAQKALKEATPSERVA